MGFKYFGGIRSKMAVIGRVVEIEGCLAEGIYAKIKIDQGSMAGLTELLGDIVSLHPTNVSIDKDTSLSITNVIFNDPATIVFWSDNTKTVVKCGTGDIFDPEKGLAMAISKKLLGDNNSSYYNEFKKWIPNNDWNPEYELTDISNFLSTALAGFKETLGGIYDRQRK